MGICVVDRKEIDLSKSLLHEDYDLTSITPEFVTGVVALNEEMKVLPMISHYLTRELSKNRISAATAKTYGKNLIYLLSYLKRFPSLKHEKLDQAYLYVQAYHIEEYLTDMNNVQGLVSKTVRNRDASFKAFFDNYLCTEFSNQKALRDDNPYEEGLLSGAPNSNLIEMCDLDEVISLIQNTPYERERTLLQFMYDSGVRRSEIPRVMKSHIDEAYSSERKSVIIDEETIQIPANYKSLYIPGSKGRHREIKPRYTIVSVHTLVRIKQYHASPLYKKFSRKFGDDKPAFLNAQGGGFTASSVSKLVERVSNRALKKRHITRPISPHKIRHGFAGGFLRSPDIGKDDVDRLVALQKCLGHSKLETTQIYTSIPYDILTLLVDENGERLCRFQLMERIAAKTKRAIKLGDKK